jgi:hypothetical protein
MGNDVKGEPQPTHTQEEIVLSWVRRAQPGKVRSRHSEALFRQRGQERQMSLRVSAGTD